jgi:hypothetical protein
MPFGLSPSKPSSSLRSARKTGKPFGKLGANGVGDMNKEIA